MVEEELRAIFDAERKAKERVEKANAQAEAIRGDARKEAGQIKEKSKSTSAAKSKKLLEECKAKTEAEVQAELAEARKRDQLRDKRLEQRKKRAVELVAKSVTRVE
jgi:V/A-type H+-transporting ATPase subunit G/H